MSTIYHIINFYLQLPVTRQLGHVEIICFLSFRLDEISNILLYLFSYFHRLLTFHFPKIFNLYRLIPTYQNCGAVRLKKSKKKQRKKPSLLDIVSQSTLENNDVTENVVSKMNGNNSAPPVRHMFAASKENPTLTVAN